MPEISFIIPTKDRQEVLHESLLHLFDAIGELSCEVLIINDSKTNRPYFNSSFSGLRVVDNPGRGVASARNFGAEVATGKVLWFLDDDIWVNRNMLERGLQLISRQPDNIFNFDWVYPPALQHQIQHAAFGRFLHKIGYTTMRGWCKGMPWEENSLFRTEWLAGATLLISAHVFQSVKGYDPSFPLAGFEDYDFSVRISKAGYDAYIDTTVCAFHYEVSKTSLRGFLQRTYNNAVTRRHAVEIGYHDHKLFFPSFKIFAYRITISLESLLLFFMDRSKIPPFLDPITTRMYKLLIGTAIYKGYTSPVSK